MRPDYTKFDTFLEIYNAAVQPAALGWFDTDELYEAFQAGSDPREVAGTASEDFAEYAKASEG